MASLHATPELVEDNPVRRPVRVSGQLRRLSAGIRETAGLAGELAALHALERLASARLALVAATLIDLGYRRDALDGILRHVGLCGSAHGCLLFVHEDHRDAVESLLPSSPAWSSPAWDEPLPAAAVLLPEAS